MGPLEPNTPPPPSHNSDVSGPTDNSCNNEELWELPINRETTETRDKNEERRRWRVEAERRRRVWDERQTKTAHAADICRLKKTSRWVSQRPCYFIDHSRTWTRHGQLVIWDDPYIPSQSLDKEEVMRAAGWRIRHLPTSMSLYVAGKCQPRLLAPPGSEADINHIADLLKLAKFQGCFELTERFYGPDPATCEVRQALAAEVICV